MAHKFSMNVARLNSEASASAAAIDPILTAAKITSLKVDGKDVTAADAPLSAKITAIGALLATGDKTQDTSELIAANGQLADQFEASEARLVTANATISAQTQQISSLQTNLTTANATVDRLTADAGTNKNLLEASNKEVSRLLAIVSAQTSTIAQSCVAANCLDFSSLGKDASVEAKTAFASKMGFDDLMKSFKGAVNAAIAKTGVTFADIPSGKPAGVTEKKDEPKGRARFSAAVKIGSGAGFQTA
jgi:hypothetical protein